MMKNNHFLYLFILTTLFISCISRNGNKPLLKDSAQIVKKKIYFLDRRKIIKFYSQNKEDSVYTYDEAGNLYRIEYDEPLNDVLGRVYYKNNKIQSVLYSKYENDSAVELTYSDDGALIEKCIGYDKWVRTKYIYYENGKIEIKLEQGTFSGGIVNREEINYDQSGILLKKTKYDHTFKEGDMGYDHIYVVASTTEYYPDSTIKLISHAKGYIEGGCTCPCSKWQYFNEKGKLIKTTQYGSCYDFKIDCCE